jgi:hypothetical protein
MKDEINVPYTQEEFKKRLAEHDRIWNAAIEAAANLVQDEMGDPDDTFWIVEKVRKLKK